MAGSIGRINGTTSNPLNQTYRVTLDVPKIQANVLACEGGRLSEREIRNWLLSVGFSPEPGGNTWLVAGENLWRLDKSEVVATERVAGECDARSRM